MGKQIDHNKSLANTFKILGAHTSPAGTRATLERIRVAVIDDRMHLEATDGVALIRVDVDASHPVICRLQAGCYHPERSAALATAGSIIYRDDDDYFPSTDGVIPRADDSDGASALFDPDYLADVTKSMGKLARIFGGNGSESVRLQPGRDDTSALLLTITTSEVDDKHRRKVVATITGVIMPRRN